VTDLDPRDYDLRRLRIAESAVRDGTLLQRLRGWAESSDDAGDITPEDFAAVVTLVEAAQALNKDWDVYHDVSVADMIHLRDALAPFEVWA
jgi:hypothetical protein